MQAEVQHPAWQMSADGPDPAALARDWVTLWQSEAAAMAADRELQEGWQRLADQWAAAAQAWIAPHDRPSGRPGPAASAGTAPAAAASGPGEPGAEPGFDSGAELARLRERVAELESRLATVEGREQPGR